MKTYERILSSVGIASLAVLALSFSTGAYAIAGKFQFVNGEVQVIDAAGKQRLAQKGGAIDEGETVSSTGNGFAQIRMEDGGFFAVRPDTQFKIDTFKYEGKEDGSEKGIFSLIKGSLRSVTGVVGKKHKDNYKINTATATIGIRGSGADVGHNNSIGTAVRTLFGGHSLTSGGRTIVTGPGQTALAPPGQEPRFVPNFPFNSGTGANGQNQGGNDQPAGGTPEKKAENTEGNNPPAPPTTEQKVIIPVKSADGALDFTNPNPNIVTLAPLGSGGAVVGFDDYDGYQYHTEFGIVGSAEADCYTETFSAAINSNGALVGWKLQTSNSYNTYTRVFNAESATVTVDGRDAELGVVWGRWSEGYSYSYSSTYEGITHDGEPYNPPGGLAFVTGGHITTLAELDNFASWPIGNGLRDNVAGVISGTYSLAPGNFPTLVNGIASGTITSALATVDFTNRALNMSIAGSGGGFGTWQATGQGGFGGMTPTGYVSLNSGSCAGGAGACAGAGVAINGSARLGFVGTQAQGLISTIGLSAGADKLGAAVYMKRGAVADPLPVNLP